jgi:hypothetical protein
VFFGKFNRHPSYLFKDIADKYDGIYTFWFGSKPMIIITSIDLGRKALNQIECCDQFDSTVEKKLWDDLLDGTKIYGLMNCNDEWMQLRKISISCLRYNLFAKLICKISIYKTLNIDFLYFT